MPRLLLGSLEHGLAEHNLAETLQGFIQRHQCAVTGGDRWWLCHKGDILSTCNCFIQTFF